MNTMNEKANKALRPLLCAITRFQLPVKTATKLFHTLITPIALYNVEIWATMTNKQLEKFEVNDPFGYVEKSKLDILHRKLLKYVLGLNKTCPNTALYGDTGETPISIKGYKLMVDYWNRLCTLPESSLAKKALKENVNIRTNWIMTIEKLLKTFNLIETSDHPKFKVISKAKTNLYYNSLWDSEIKNVNSSRLNFYQRLKVDRKPAIYTYLPSFNQRKAIAKLRCSNHQLEIEKGRHKNVPREERICKLCTDKTVEDEDHFLLKCRLYDHLKTEYQIPSDDSVSIMNTENQENLDQFLISAFILGEDTLDKNS